MYHHYDFGGLGVLGLLITIALIIISICITVAPLLIWRNGNRTNRLLALLALHSGIPSNKIQDIYLQGGSDFSEIITAMSDRKPEDNNNSVVIDENQSLINSNITSIKNLFSDFEWVKPSPYKFYALVKHGGQFDIIEIVEYKPKIISRDEIKKMPKLRNWMNAIILSS